VCGLILLLFCGLTPGLFAQEVTHQGLPDLPRLGEAGVSQSFFYTASQSQQVIAHMVFYTYPEGRTDSIRIYEITTPIFTLKKGTAAYDFAVRCYCFGAMMMKIENNNQLNEYPAGTAGAGCRTCYGAILVG
jgi:hypothetical protein